MTLDPRDLSDHVWTRTLPALRRRRHRRRGAFGAAVLALFGLLAILLMPSRPPTSPSPLVLAPPPAGPESARDTSLAVLVVDESGARFAQLRPDEIANEGLRFDLTLDPVFRVAMLE
jgi:hypothetical protein